MAPKKEQPALCEPASGTVRRPDGSLVPWALNNQRIIVVGTCAPRHTIRLKKAYGTCDAQWVVDDYYGVAHKSSELSKAKSACPNARTHTI